MKNLINKVNYFYKIVTGQEYFEGLDPEESKSRTEMLLKKFFLFNFSHEEFKEWEDLNENMLLLIDIDNIHYEHPFNILNSYSIISNNYDEKTAIIISEKYQEPKNLYIEKEFMLKGIGNIKDLYVYMGKKSSISPKDATDIAGYANYMYIYDFLKEYVSRHGNDEFIYNFKKLINENKSKIDKISNIFKYRPIKLSEGGADGMPFDIGDGRVLKLFTDHEAYSQALRGMNRLHKGSGIGKTEAMLYDVGELGEYDGRSIYYYIIELMVPLENEPISDSVNRIMSFIKLKLNNNRNWIKWRKLLKDSENNFRLHQKISNKIKEEIEKETAIIINDLNQNENNKSNINYINRSNSLATGWLEELIEELIVKLITGRGDLHLGNIGITRNKKLRFFDPAYSFERDKI